MITGEVLKLKRTEDREADGAVPVNFKIFPDHKKILFCSVSFMFANLQIFLFRYYHQDTEYVER